MSDESTLNDLYKKIFKANSSHHFLLGFYLCQLFEFQLRYILITCISGVRLSIKTKQLSYEPEIKDNWNANDYFQRILVFYPKNKNQKFYQAVNKAIKDRNNFVHKSFKPDTNTIFLPNEKFEELLNTKASVNLLKWLGSFRDAQDEILLLLARFSRREKEIVERIKKRKISKNWPLKI